MLRYIFVLFAAILVATSLGSSANAGTLKIGDPAPKIDGTEWINSPPLKMNDLTGHVVLVEFWTYG